MHLLVAVSHVEWLGHDTEFKDETSGTGLAGKQTDSSVHRVSTIDTCAREQHDAYGLTNTNSRLKDTPLRG